MLDYLHGDFGADAGEGPAFLDRHDAVGPFHALDDGSGIKGPERPQIYHFGFYSFFAESFGSFHGDAYHDAEPNDGYVPTGALDLRPANRQDKLLVGRAIEGLAVKDFVFKHNNRVRITYSRAQQPLRIGARPG